MKPAPFLLLAFTAGLLLSAATASAAPAATPVIAPKPVDRFERTKARIDTLLARRLQPPDPLPAKIANPFQTTGSDPAPDTAPTAPAGFTPADDNAILAYYAQTLKISGQMQADNQTLIIINSSPHKEGDFVAVSGKDDATYYLKIIRIARNEVTLGYNEAVFTLPLK